MISYPTYLPLPDSDSYSGVIDYGLIRSSVPASRANQVRGFNSPTTNISLSFSMANDLYIYWRDWINTNGYSWFEMPTISGNQPVDITSTHAVRITGGINYTKQGDNWLTVAVQVELIPGEPQDPAAG